jgi:hypothetical protein
MMKAFITTILLIGLMVQASLQAQEKWTWHGHGPNGFKDEADGIAVDKFGNTYIAGGFSRTVFFQENVLRSQGLRDIYFAKISPMGETLWIQTLATKNDENIFDMTIDNAGDLLLSGFQEINYNGKIRHSALIIKADSGDGSIKWKSYFPADIRSGGNEIAFDKDNNIYATVTSAGALNIEGKKIANGGDKDSHLIKLNPQGQFQWRVSADGRGPERIRAVGVGYDGTRIVVGYEFRVEMKIGNQVIKGRDHRSPQGAYLVVDNHGKVVRIEQLTGSVHSNVRASGGFSDGLYVHGTFVDQVNVAGASLKGFGSRDSFLLKIDKNGELQWHRTLGNSDSEDGGEMAVSIEGDVYLTGNHTGRDYHIRDHIRTWTIFKDNFLKRTGYILRFSKSGRLKQNYTLEPQSNQNSIGVIAEKNGNVSVGIGFIGSISVGDDFYQAGSNKDKDFVILGL